MGDDNEVEAGPDLAQGVPAAAVREGQPLLGQVEGQPVLLVRAAGAVHAVAAHCTHWSGPLAEGLVVGDTIRCPWHHACFSLRDGAVLGPPGLRPLACWQVHEQGGQVWVSGAKPPAPPAAPPRQPEAVVIVGAGAAGDACAFALREFGHDGSITLIGAEATATLDRPNLSKDFLAGNAPAEWLPLRADGDYTERRITLRTGVRVQAIDRAARHVHLSDGGALRYDALLLATGAQPVAPSLPGADAPHVHTLRTLADVQAILARVAGGAKRAVVVGASFIGLEVAASLRARGLAVAVVAPEAAPLARVFGPRLAARIRREHEQRIGTVFHLGRKPVAIDAQAVTLDDGTRLPADLVVFGIGVRPDVALAQAAGLAVDDGIVVDAQLRSSDPAIWAAGDVARYPDPLGGGPVRIEHWAVAQAQGRLAARNMLGFGEAFATVPFFWSQHGGLAISYVGHATQWDAVQEDGDPDRDDYLCRYLRGGRVLAVASIGRDRDSLAEQARMEASFAAV